MRIHWSLGVRVGLEDAGLEVDGEPGGVVGAGQVVHRSRLLLLFGTDNPRVLLDGQHFAPMGNGVH